jgi:DNA-binding CsgD family transcriptional regulator
LCADPSAHKMSGVPVMARQFVGRAEELEAIHLLLDAPEQLSAVAALPGEAGIGKTTLWLAGIDAAAVRGYRILSARPSGAETQFAFGGLTDLLRDAAGDVLPELPPIQRRALEAALLLGESQIDADHRAVATAFLEALRTLARDSPLCLAVDDVQWLDAASHAALDYALARLDRAPVAGLLAVRGDVPEWLRRAVPEERLRTVAVAGLSLGATHELLRARLDARFARPALIRLWETSRGNPFFALELAAALQRAGGTLAPGNELPIPSSLDELLHARIESLGRAALEVARSVGALADPTVGLLEAALGARFDPGLAEALDARILELDGERVRFTHPLLGSTVATRQTPARRRSLHARLADVVPSAEERARHLALATAEPNGDVARLLEAAARTAQARGAPAPAADLAEQALQLTPRSSPDDARRRLHFAADMHHRAGNTARAIELLERARVAAAPGNERARVLTRLADVQVTTPVTAIGLYYEALEEAADDELRASIYIGLASMIDWGEGIEKQLEHAELAVRTASRVADTAVRCRALGVYGVTHFFAGRGIATATMEEAISLERSLAEWPLDDGPTEFFAYQLAWAADIERGREAFQELANAGKSRNDATTEAWALYFLGFLEWRAGNWEEADRYIVDSLDLYAQLDILMPTEFCNAAIAAHRGRIDEARARAQGAIIRGKAEGMRIAESLQGWVLGFVELSLGDASTALVHLRRSYEVSTEFMLEPAMRVELGDLLEALIAIDELEEADEVLAAWQERANALDRAWALAILARCRGLLLAARGDLEGAFACFDRAFAEHDRSSDPFQNARTLLALGRTQRRAKKRGAARTTLEDALTRFEHLGAPLWAEQARVELARIGGRASSRRDLTQAERRIAALVADGRTNREVAAALFVTEHTVEGALTRVYRKLGIRSRTELAHRLGTRDKRRPAKL